MIATDKNSKFNKIFHGVDVCNNIGENIKNMVNQSYKGNKSEDGLWVFTMEQKWCQ